MSVPNKLVCGNYKNDKNLCFSDARATNSYLPSSKKFSVNINDGKKYKCPKYYKKIPNDTSITLGGEPYPLYKGSLIKAKNIRGHDKIDGYEQVMVACELDKYTSDEDKARCYMNDIPIGQSSISYDYYNKQYIVNNKDRCPPLDADSKHIFMTRYCSDSDGVFGDKKLCNEWWNEDEGSRLQNRDNLAINFCKNPQLPKNIDPSKLKQYKSRCACINAKPPRDLPEAVAWIFNAECGDPTKNAYHTQNMKNITWQDCRQYWDIYDIHDSTIRNVAMEQTCIMNFPDTKPAAEIIPSTPPNKPSTPPTKPSTPPTKPNTPPTKPNTPPTKPNTPPTKPNTPSNMPDIIPSNIPAKNPDNTPPNRPSKPTNNDTSETEGVLNQEINGIKLIYIIFFFILVIFAALYSGSRSHRSKHKRNYNYEY